MPEEKLTESQKAAIRRFLTALKTWWHRPVGQDRVEVNELVEAIEDARETLDCKMPPLLPYYGPDNGRG